MQIRIPLFSSPAIVRVDTGSEVVPLLDLSGDADQDITRFVTLYAAYYRETPDGSSANTFAAFGTGGSVGDLAGGVTLYDSAAFPARVLDQYPIRGDVSLSCGAAIPSGGFVALWGFYTVAEASSQKTIATVELYPYTSESRFNVLDKRPLQPDNTVPDAATIPVESGDALEDAVPLHVVPTNSPYLDEVTVDVYVGASTETRVYFEDYPDNFIIVRGFSPTPPARGSVTGLWRVLDGIPFRAQGRLMLAGEVDNPENPPAIATGFFVRY